MTDNTTTSASAEVLPEAGRAVAAAIRAGADADLSAPTPCHDWDLRTLAKHFVGTTGAFVRAGRDRALDPDDPWGSSAQLDEADWSGQLAGQVEAMAEAWSDPGAWDGSVEGAPMPAMAIGELGFIELMLHGWDVARAAGQPLEVSDAVGAELLRCLEPTLEQGRQMDVYADPVEVPADASALDRALGLAGRDPRWTP